MNDVQGYLDNLSPGAYAYRKFSYWAFR
jgi:hypothetical protein